MPRTISDLHSAPPRAAGAGRGPPRSATVFRISSGRRTAHTPPATSYDFSTRHWMDTGPHTTPAIPPPRDEPRGPPVAHYKQHRACLQFQVYRKAATAADMLCWELSPAAAATAKRALCHPGLREKIRDAQNIGAAIAVADRLYQPLLDSKVDLEFAC